MPSFIKKLSIRIFLPIATLFFVAIVVIIGWIYTFQKNLAEERSIEEIKLSEKRFSDIEMRDTKAINSVLNVLLEDERIKDLYLKKNKDELYEYCQTLFLKNKELYGITHWYFINLDDSVFLRMHGKEISGDIIERVTYRKAKDFSKVSSGLELGKTAFALRVVSPYYKDGELIGYMELAQEIDHFLVDIRENENKSLALVVSKEKLDRDDWEYSRQVAGLRNNWDDSQEYVFVSTNVKDGNIEYDALRSFLRPESFMHPQDEDRDYLLGKYEAAGEKFDVGEFHIKDASGEEAGTVYVALKNTTLYEQAITKTIIMIALLLLFSYVFFLLIWAVIKSVIVKPLDSIRAGIDDVSASNYNTELNLGDMGEMGRFAKDFNEMVSAIRKSRSDIEKKVAEQVKEIESKKEELVRQNRAMVNVLEDIENEKNKAEKLALELNKFKLAVDNASDHIAITDSDGKVLYGNKAVEKITGYSLSEVIGQKAGTKNNWGGNMDKEFYEKLWKTVKKDKKSFSGRVENIRKNGEKYHAETNISPILDEKGMVKFFVAIERDITKEVEVDRVKTEFVSLASHQLRTPLSAFKWDIEILKDSIPKGKSKKSKDLHELIQEMHECNEGMIDLVNGLLNVSRIDMGTFAIDPKDIDPRDIVETVIRELRPILVSKEVNIITSYNKGIKTIFADPKLLKVVVQNLLSNAVKYSHKNGDVKVSVKKDGSFILISVKDSGMGIPREEQSKIFSKLFRAENAIRKISDGTGLGLYVARAVVEQTGGKIWFESKENTGTTFYFTVPIKGMIKKEGNKELSPTK